MSAEINWSDYLQKLQLQPGDIVLLKVPDIEMSVMVNVHRDLREILPDEVQLIILELGFDMEALRVLDIGAKLDAIYEVLQRKL